jgi:hypothetical protein
MLRNLADRHAELAESADHLGVGHLRRDVVAVAGVRIDLGGLQQPGLVVTPQRFHAQVGDLGEVTDAQARTHDSTVGPPPPGESNPGAELLSGHSTP